MSRSLVIGGAGFIGFHLSKHLANDGQEVTILDNFQRGSHDLEFKKLASNKKITFIKADITDPQTFVNLKNNFDWIYHLAAINGTENFYNIPDKVLKVGTVGTINVLDWYARTGNGTLLFSSSSETYAGAMRILNDFPMPTPEDIPLVIDDPKNVRWSYGTSKILGEVAIYSYAKAHNFNNFKVIRYHNIYGPRMGFEHVIPQFIGRIVKNEDPFTIYGGDATRTFCYVDDGIRATQLIMEEQSLNGQIVHIGRSDEEIKILDLAKMVFEIANKSPRIEIKDPPSGSVMRRCPDTTKLRNIGFNPEINLNEGLKLIYAWYKDKF